MWRMLPVLAALAGAAAGAAAGDDDMVWRVERLDGTVLTDHRADERFNPASVVKVATSLWAVKRLGVSYRYETRFLIDGPLDRETGTVDGDLVVHSGGDPDFHPENAWLGAAALNRYGVRRVAGDLVVSGPFRLGWEGGIEDRRSTETARRLQSGDRLLRTWNPARWGPELQRVWLDLGRRSPESAAAPPKVVVEGDTRIGEMAGTVVTVHRSNSLGVLLKRFNVFSNNDIIRIADTLGGVETLEAFLRRVVADDASTVELESASGEGRNRMTAKQVVALLRRFRGELQAAGRSPRELLPVPGCDPGPVPEMFPDLAEGDLARSVACKTGTLAHTDGGVAVLAGYVTTAEDGELLFCVAAENDGRKLGLRRHRQQRWLIDLLRSRGGPVAPPCPPPMLYSDSRARVEVPQPRP